MEVVVWCQDARYGENMLSIFVYITIMMIKDYLIDFPLMSVADIFPNFNQLLQSVMIIFNLDHHNERFLLNQVESEVKNNKCIIIIYWLEAEEWYGSNVSILSMKHVMDATIRVSDYKHQQVSL